MNSCWIFKCIVEDRNVFNVGIVGVFMLTFDEWERVEELYAEIAAYGGSSCGGRSCGVSGCDLKGDGTIRVRGRYDLRHIVDSETGDIRIEQAEGD